MDIFKKYIAWASVAEDLFSWIGLQVQIGFHWMILLSNTLKLFENFEFIEIILTPQT